MFDRICKLRFSIFLLFDRIIIAAAQAVICITGTCVHDKISEQLSPLHEVKQAWINIWDKVKKYL